MNKPFKYTIICNKNKNVVMETNQEPLLHQLQTWEETSEPNVRELKLTKTVYIDTRYEAKLRLFNYVNFIKKGFKFQNTDLMKEQKLENLFRYLIFSIMSFSIGYNTLIHVLIHKFK